MRCGVTFGMPEFRAVMQGFAKGVQHIVNNIRVGILIICYARCCMMSEHNAYSILNAAFRNCRIYFGGNIVKAFRTCSEVIPENHDLYSFQCQKSGPNNYSVIQLHYCILFFAGEQQAQ